MRGTGKFEVTNNILLIGPSCISVGSSEWYAWLAQHDTFSFHGKSGHFTAQRETRRQKTFWYAYRRRDGKLYKQYLGKSEELTPDRLEGASRVLSGQTFLEPSSHQPSGESSSGVEARIDTSLLPMNKFNTPVLPLHLIARPRLTRQINARLVLISAPSGFGKTTLLCDWKQVSGRPVAWLTLDENDNQAMRFWYSIVTALRTLLPDFGDELLTYLRSAAPIQPSEIFFRLTNHLINAMPVLPRFSLVIDDFQHITRAEIYTPLQAWLEQLPPNMQLVILSHTKPALSLGNLRARTLLTELDASDLRFTLEEGIRYLRQFPQEPPLAHTDLEKLVKHTEGWAAGLTLTAIALSKHENRRQFIETFGGAHMYLREYFLETVLQQTGVDVQEFLLKTSVLKNLTGSLCDAVTGQTGGEAMLSRLWRENLFIDQLEEQGWYRYHDLFAEMLNSQLKTRFPNQIAQLHQRAAQWYREQNAPADAVYHLLAIKAWEEAASLIEGMALRELEQYGEDSRLLRWLQELPEDVVQKHKTLLFVYLRLAELALPKQKIEQFIARIETNISRKAALQQTQDERDVLEEIGRIRLAWDQGDMHVSAARIDGEYDARWEVLDGLQLLKQEYAVQPELWETHLSSLLHKAQAQGNLFVILMAGGVLARFALVSGQLRRSEKIARQVLDQALLRRGKLPEPASIALAVLSEVYLERNDLEPAQRYLAQAQEVDPNPTSSNMLVQNAILQARIQAAQGKFDEALASIRAIRELHGRRPSGSWTNQDLLVHEALILLRKGELSVAEQLLAEGEGSAGHSPSQLVQAKISLANGQTDAAEELLNRLIAENPVSISNEPLLSARVLLALALYRQHKNHLALQVITDAIRLAAPERFYRPFLENTPGCIPLLLLAQARIADKPTGDVQVFLKEILRLTGRADAYSPSEIEALSTSASISLREQEVLNLLSSGFTNGEIASRLCVSESTVKTHLRNIYTKLGVNSRIQAIKSAKELRLI